MKIATIATAALALSAVAAAAAEDQKPERQLTVLEALNVGEAMRQLGDHQGPDGKTVAVPFKFDGGVLMAMAVDIAAADQVKKNYQTTYNALVKRFAAGGDKVPAEKMPEFNEQTERAIAAPSGAIFARVKQADLCLDAKPTPPCTATNAIPPALLAAILPVVDR